MAKANTTMDVLSLDECIDLLTSTSVGRIGVVVGGSPYVLPVNYRWVASADSPYVAVRTRPGNVIDRAVSDVAFEIDGVDDFHRCGWSVLVRGTLHHLGQPGLARELIDPHPWLDEDRDSWLLIEPKSISGRRLRAGEIEWAFHIQGYL
jgi:nitroimidazol reductase NimA-like FMN-containing flavoprotein (pyridoxamine 5'-phosphate oxidase superfamily)